MSFIDQFQLAQDGEFIGRVTMAMQKSANAIYSEAPSTPGHTQRAQFAVGVLAQPQTKGRQYSFSVASNPSITSESSDNDIEFTVNSMWDAWANADTA